MLEKDLGLRTRETFIGTSQPEFPTIPYVMRGTVYAFGGKVKREIHQDFQERCAMCGSTARCECHHVIKEEWHGKGAPENGVLLCGPKGRDCHDIFDKLADKGIVWPGIPVEEADPSLWRSPKDREKTLKKFGR